MFKEEWRFMPAIMLFCLGSIFTIMPAIHWNDDKEYKVIECTSYEIEVIHVERNNSTLEEKYKIYYK